MTWSQHQPVILVGPISISAGCEKREELYYKASSHNYYSSLNVEIIKRWDLAKLNILASWAAEEEEEEDEDEEDE